MEDNELVDVWRLYNPEVERFTCHKRNSTSFSRIDFFLVSASLLQSVQSTQIKPSFNSDHSILITNIDLDGERRGRGFWKFNALLLNDQEHNNAVEMAFHHAVFVNADSNPALKWEMIKLGMIQASIDFARTKASVRNQKLKELNDDLDWLVTQLEIDPQGEQEIIETMIQHKKDQIQEIMEDKFCSLVFRSKCQFYAEGERSSKYYFNLEKSRYNNRSLTQI